MTHHYTSRTGDIGGDDQIGTRICRLLADITCLHIQGLHRCGLYVLRSTLPREEWHDRLARLA